MRTVTAGNSSGINDGAAAMILASQLALKKAGLSIDDIDLIEANEAFSAQYLAVEKNSA